ncbi:MAG: hypothetical protein PG979_001098 [Rickettsia asembonensis]|nr:hypothetical protein [Rickettsia asembonensis]WCR57041.1 MAG: hypothetical protein PG979_001098 [Rickettsia asembonensis]
MTKDEIAELFKKCLALHNRYQYQEGKDNLRKFVETDPEELSNFIENYNKTEKYNNREAEIFHSLSSILMEKQQDNAIKSLKKAIELDPSKAYYHEEFFNKLHKINPEEALASIKRAIGLNPNKKSLYEDFIILLKKANYDEEAAKITEAIQDFPKNIPNLVLDTEEIIEVCQLGDVLKCE